MSKLESFSDLFQNILFRIPDYQRGYAWKQNQLVDFWDDVTHLQGDRSHYMGLLSLKMVPKEEAEKWDNAQWLIHSRGYSAYHVVDGQQRLTTFSILMNEILSFVKGLDENDGKSEDEIVINYETLTSIRSKYISQTRPPQNMVTTYVFGYESESASAEYLNHKVYGEPQSMSLTETYYTNNLKFAKNFFQECLIKLYALEGFEGLENLYHKLAFQLMFNIHQIEKDYDVFVAFETMNNRGKKSTNLELLKNRLVYLTTLYDSSQLDSHEKDELRDQINDAWKEIYYQLGRNPNTPLADDDFLRAHWSIYYQYTRNTSSDYIDFLLSKFSALNIYDKHIVLLDEETTEPVTDHQVLEDESEDEIEERVEDSASLNVSNLTPLEIRSYVKSLKDLSQYWFQTHFPMRSDLSDEEQQWLKRLDRVGIGYFRPLVALSLLPELNITEDERVSLYTAVERFIFICFRMGTYQSNFKSSYYYRAGRSLYNGEISVHDVIRSLNQTVSEELNTASSNFTSKMVARFSKHDGFYSWRDVRYVLYEYEFEKAAQAEEYKIDWTSFTHVDKDRVTIEHILPQNPDEWYWRNQFRHFTDKEIKVLSSSLGNLLPLSESVSASTQNLPFEEKVSGLAAERRGYKDGSHSEIEISGKEDWTAEDILERGLEILRFMERRWDFSFRDEKQMLELLQLDFVKEDREDVPEIPEEITLNLDEEPKGSGN